MKIYMIVIGNGGCMLTISYFTGLKSIKTIKYE